MSPLLSILLLLPSIDARAAEPVIAPFTEIDALDPPTARIRRYAVTTRGVPGRELELPESQRLFCTLDWSPTLTLSYYASSDVWIVQVRDNAEAARAATGLVTCLNVQAAP